MMHLLFILAGFAFLLSGFFGVHAIGEIMASNEPEISQAEEKEFNEWCYRQTWKQDIQFVLGLKSMAKEFRKQNQTHEQKLNRSRHRAGW